MIEAAEQAQIDDHWHQVVVPQLLEEAKRIRNVIDLMQILARKPKHRRLALKTLVKMWEMQFDSLILYAEGSDEPERSQAFAALREQRGRLIQLRERVRGNG